MPTFRGQNIKLHGGSGAGRGDNPHAPRLAAASPPGGPPNPPDKPPTDPNWYPNEPNKHMNASKYMNASKVTESKQKCSGAGCKEVSTEKSYSGDPMCLNCHQKYDERDS